jgi:iron complex outermembrane recepter protein
MKLRSNQHDSVRHQHARMFATASMAILSFAMVDGLAGQALAQAADQGQAAAKPQAATEVVVTGSRIARRDFTSNSPIVTVNSQAFQNTSNVAVEATLNKLPQFTPDQNGLGTANNGDVQPTGTHTVGISTVSMRGFGPNRNLVLADGQRLMPSNGELVVDINSIPSAIIDHVEAITGGASAVYGADAVAGVVNFILKKNYQGMDVDAQYGVTQAGDGQEFKVSTVFGANFADDRGNVTFAMEHYTRAAAMENNRSFYQNGWSDPTVGSNEFFNTGVMYNPEYGNLPSQSVVNSIFSQAPANSIPGSGGPQNYKTGVPFYFNGNGTVYTANGGGFNSGATAGTYAYTGPINGKSVAYVDVSDPWQGYTKQQSIKTNQTNYYVEAPLSRWSMFGDAHYDITDNLTAYIRGQFSSMHTSTVLFPTPFITGWAAEVPYDAATNGAASGHPVSAQLATLLNSRPNPNAPWELELIPDPGGWMPARSTVDDNTVYQLSGGLKGKLPFGDFTWDLNGSHGQASNYTLGGGYTSLERYKAMIEAPNYGAGASITGNQGAPNYGFGSATSTCTSGFYSAIFQGGTPSQDCINSITASLQSRTLMEQNVVEFDTQGTLFHLPAGDLKISLGADYRDDSDQYTPDILQSTSSFLDQVAGVYPTAYMDASTSAREGYGELLIPVVSDLPFVKHFDLGVGARYSTYTAANHLTGQNITPPGGWTYKIEGDWAVNDWARIRGGYNLAVRAPNVGELFLGKQEVYAAGAATAYGDPCSLLATAPFGANAAKNASAAGVQKVCSALMGAAGSAYYYGSPQAPGAASGFGFVEQQGNPNLNSEKAHTWTAGLVLSSPWQNPLLNRMHASIDWYSIRLNGAIEFNSVDNVKAACFDQATAGTTDAEAATIAASPACQLLQRNTGTGAEAPTTIITSNLATIRTSGFDFNFDWAGNLADMGLSSVPGQVRLNVVANYLNYFDTQSQPGAAWLHWAGTLGPTLTGLDAGAFKFKTNTTLTYLVGPATVSLNWRYLPHVHAATYPTQGLTGYTTDCAGCTQDTKATHLFDLSATYTYKTKYVFRFGIDNLFNTQPPIVGATMANGQYVLASDGAGSTSESLYDALGRRFYVGINAKF